MVKLSVNVNKIATLRNARGGKLPDPVRMALDCERFGADGITVHPRPDQRHITTEDVYHLKKCLTKEFNIEGYPDETWMKMVLEVKPDQATLVPDAPDAITSDHGWDCLAHAEFLKSRISLLKAAGIRVSVFLDPNPLMISAAKAVGADRIELYTESYAAGYAESRESCIIPYQETAQAAIKMGLGVNAGHDLSLENLAWFATQIPELQEVSIGHALIADALYFGMHNTVQMYLKALKKN